MKGRISELVKQLNKHNTLYYNQEPIISDMMYDRLMTELVELELEYPALVLPNSPTKTVGADVLSVNTKFSKSKHKFNMLSLSNSYNKADIRKFLHRLLNDNDVSELDIVLEHKYDGCSISLTYENGVLVSALSRGNGAVGEEILDNILAISDIPKRVDLNEFKDTTIVVRGEILLSRERLKSLNVERVANGLPPYANCRNTVAGTLRILSSAEVARRGLESRMYSIHEIKDTQPNQGLNVVNTQSDALLLMKAGGFNVDVKLFNIEKIRDVTDAENVIVSLGVMETTAKNMPVDTDGVVIKCNNLVLSDEMGRTSRSPRAAIAFKFNTEIASTVLRNVTWYVGRSGICTPVGKFDSVNISGTSVNQASLHNFQHIKKLNLRLSSVVLVEKAAEIIPQIISIDPNNVLSDELTTEILEPVVCPSCGKPLTYKMGKTGVFCVNASCPDILVSKLTHLVGRDALNVDGLGPNLIIGYIADGVIRNMSDLFILDTRLKEYRKGGTLMGMELHIIKSMETTRKAGNPVGVIVGLGIPLIGRTYSAKLINKFLDVRRVFNASDKELATILGNAALAEFTTWRDNDSNKELINHIVDSGFNNALTPKEVKSGVFNGVSFVITGTLEEGRQHYEELIKNLGGSVTSSVNKNTGFILFGDNPGKSKMDKGISLNTNFVSEDMFKKMTLNAIK